VWDPVDGLHLNSQRVKMRGFCNHESFAGVGAAIPPRIDLVRIQQMRGVGGNAWRTSHNPPEPALLDVADRLGILVLDENRVLATVNNCPGDSGNPNTTCANGYVPMYRGDVAADTGNLALRDRNHASVVSACAGSWQLFRWTSKAPLSSCDRVHLRD
jgi:beta-galactosidase/beta-glucuronidase